MKRRILIAAALVGALAGGCDDGSGPNNQITGDGVTRVLLTDSPFPYDMVASVDVHVVSVAVSTTADTGASAGDQPWTTVATPNQRFNLLDLHSGTTALIGETELDAGEYRAVRLVINTTLSRIMLTNGVQADVDWQYPGEITLNALVEQPIDVPDGGGRIVIDFDVGRSFIPIFASAAAQPSFLFIPWIRAVDESSTGSISGVVTGPSIEGEMLPLADVAISVFRGDSGMPAETWGLAASARTNGEGRFVVPFLRAGTYIVRADAPAAFVFAPSIHPGIVVRYNEERALVIELQRQTGGGGNGASLLVYGISDLILGHTANLYALVWTANGDSVQTDNVFWRSSAPDIVSIEQPAIGGSHMATVRARGLGVAVIYAMSPRGDEERPLTDSTVIFVRSSSPSEPGIKIYGMNTIAVGETWTFGAYILTEDRDSVFTDNIEWRGTNPDIASIARPTTGNARTADVLGRAIGRAFIVARGGGFADSVAIAVVARRDSSGGSTAPVATVQLNPSSYTINPGDSVVVVATMKDAAGHVLSGKTASWTTSSAAIVRIENNGPSVYAHLRGVASGTATITATSEGKSGTATIAVR